MGSTPCIKPVQSSKRLRGVPQPARNPSRGFPPILPRGNTSSYCTSSCFRSTLYCCFLSRLTLLQTPAAAWLAPLDTSPDAPLIASDTFRTTPAPPSTTRPRRALAKALPTCFDASLTNEGIIFVACSVADRMTAGREGRTTLPQ